ncbi:MAG: radical SAM protein [Candidatus Woesearchaeota archaeon]
MVNIDISKMKNYKKFDGDLLLTTVCPVNCKFCIYSCSLKGEWMPEKTIRRVATEYTKNDIGIRICGGEPFYDIDKLLRCLDILLEYQKASEILLITSGFFGKSVKKTKEYISYLKERNIDTLILSSDRFHLNFIPYSSLINIIKECQKKDIVLILRISLDNESYNYIDNITKIIVQYDPMVELHDNYGFFGKAELIDKNIIFGNENNLRKYFCKKIDEYQKKFNIIKKVKDYLIDSPKRSQKNFGASFFPTTFPNGNIYADSRCVNATLMGNLNKDSLQELIKKFKKTLPGYILLSENSNCYATMKKLLYVKENVHFDFCDYCRNIQLTNYFAKEAIGRKYFEINMSVINKIQSLILKNKDYQIKELLISFNFEEEELNYECGKKIISFLNIMKINKIRIKISRPIPRCVLKQFYSKITNEYQIPKNCYECSELFVVKNEIINSCKFIGKRGPKIFYMENRNMIHEFFNTLRLNNLRLKKCLDCIYYLRKQCDGICFFK